MRLFRSKVAAPVPPDGDPMAPPGSHPIPAGARIFTSWSPKVTVAHVKSALHPGAVCEAMSQREDWLGAGSDEERYRAASLRLCSRCATGDYGDGSKAS
jgi:hypothetical protein